jgi:DsbC/DsbD-like thiol-disulfide interchange protein
MRLRLFCIGLVLLLGAGFSRLAAQVQASLVAGAEPVRAEQPFTVALKLVHEKAWHTYWINPGIGYPTTLKWTLPAGWTAGPIQWPTPKLIRDAEGKITGQGYDGTVYLPVTITPGPAVVPGAEVTLNATAKWLACEAVCTPGEAALTLTLPARATTDTAALAETLAALPRAVPEWTATASRSGEIVSLRLSRSPGSTGAVPTNLRFFSADKTVAFNQSQTMRASDAGEIILDVPLTAELDAPPSRLIGVVRAEGSWTTTEAPLTGLNIDVPITAGAATINVTRASASAAVVVPSLGGTLFLAFVGGLILNLMPCVFPVLGIKILGFVNQAGNDVCGRGARIVLGTGRRARDLARGRRPTRVGVSASVTGFCVRACGGDARLRVEHERCV